MHYNKLHKPERNFKRTLNSKCELPTYVNISWLLFSCNESNVKPKDSKDKVESYDLEIRYPLIKAY